MELHLRVTICPSLLTVILVHFVVTSQGASTTWAPQSSETITWEVAGTESAPVDSPNVDILFSTDGGQNFDVIIAEDIPNNGSAELF